MESNRQNLKRFSRKKMHKHTHCRLILHEELMHNLAVHLYTNHSSTYISVHLQWMANPFVSIKARKSVEHSKKTRKKKNSTHFVITTHPIQTNYVWKKFVQSSPELHFLRQITHYRFWYFTIQAIAFSKYSPCKIIKKGQRVTLLVVFLQIKFTSYSK